ncbi:hypothetical protein [Streptomyces sp. NPDC050504]|uniref:hypothetical protein n=1 Tax=Streptomyces sp. NPDC050504 TaxID=3365618 RepID=UPI0037BD89EF
MATTVVGFGLGDDAKSRQMTVLVTQTGVRHLARGPYGPRCTLSVPCPPSGRNPVHAQISNLRAEHSLYVRRGYTRVLIPPACVSVDVDEHPMPPRPDDAYRPERHRELLEAFVAAAPDEPRELEEAIHDFYTAVGVPARPRPVPPPVAPPQPPPRIQALLHTLAHGRTITSPPVSAINYRVTADTVRLHVGTAGEDLDRRRVTELHAALTAWLHLNQPPPPRGSVPAPRRPVRHEPASRAEEHAEGA